MNMSLLYAFLLYKLFQARVVHSNVVADMTYPTIEEQRDMYLLQNNNNDNNNNDNILFV